MTPFRQVLRAFGLLSALAALALHTSAQAQAPKSEVNQPPGAGANTGMTDDVAEQLVAQVEQWFAGLAMRREASRAFTGITRDGRQLIIALDGLPFDDGKRRDFLIWLNQKYGLIAYAYATRALKRKEPGQDPVEALDITASSRAKDVFSSLSLSRQPDGSMKYVRDAYLSDTAKERKDQIFSGLNRSPYSGSPADHEEFEKVWATLESKVHWRGVRTAEPPADDANAMISRALQLYASGNCDTSLPLAEKAAALLLAKNGAQSAEFAMALVTQALCHKRLVHVADAERLYRQAIEIYEKVQGPNGRDLAIALDNLASLYAEHGRLPEAEQLRLRALQIFRATLDPASPHIATTLQNLAVLYQSQGRLPEAQQLFLEAMAIAEKSHGAESRQVGVMADNVAGLYRSRRQFSQAEKYYLRAVSIFETTLGRDHPDTALALQNYAILLGESGQQDKAEANLKRALGINERLYGASHSTIAAALNTLVLQYIEQQRWPEALEASRRATAINVELARHGKVSVASEGGQGGSTFRRLVQVAYAAGPTDPNLMNEGFIAAQRALETEAALALSQLAVRYASGDGALARLLRERQDLVREIESRDKLLIAAVTKAPNQRDGTGEESLKSRIRDIGGRVEEIDLTLRKQFPQYAALSKPAPISIAATQALLHPDEALLQFLDLQTIGNTPETAFAWLITKTEVQWARLPIGTHALARAVATLRCGIDATRWQEGGARVCRDLLKVEAPSSLASLPFNFTVAYELYQTLLGPFEAKIKGKQLMIVPSGALTRLPLSVLVTEKPGDSVLHAEDGYRKAAWLGSRQAITVLPSVASLEALRKFARQGRAERPFLGIGNPLLDGDAGSPTDADRAERAREQQQCPKSRPSLGSRVAGAVQNLRLSGALFRSGRMADVGAVRQLTPLPETTDELCAVAQALGVTDPDSEVLLGSRATEANLKAMSRDGRLERYQILQFATHGVLPSEAEVYLKAAAEPGLVLTPPQTADSVDDGLLTASEVSELKLNADWVVLSACNTAAGAAGNTEALSGLARAFFYAGARALLVSHWEVGSDAAVKLTTRAFGELKAKPKIGRAEALRVSMRELIQNGTLAEAHPSQWAPFVVVGDGAR